MQESTSREKVLKNIRNAVMYKSDLPFDKVSKDVSIYATSYDDPVVEFVEKISANGIGFVYCPVHKDIVAALQKIYEIAGGEGISVAEQSLAILLQEAQIPILLDSLPNETDIIVSYCESLIASNGSILLSSNQKDFEKFVSAKVHIVVGSISQVVENVKEGIVFLQAKYNKLLPAMFTFIGAPSSTKAIENKFITPALGAKLFLLLTDNLSNENTNE